MDFSNTTTTKAGILQTCELLLDLGDGGITGNTVLLAQFTNLANRSYDNIVAQILQNEGDYTWDDSNYTDFPIAVTALVDGQADYILPTAANGGSFGSIDASSFLRLIKVMVLDTGGFYQSLSLLTETMAETPLETLFNTTGFPRFYKPLDDSVFLYPTPSALQVTLAAGLKMFFQRDKIDFLSTDTTRQPGFPSIYHYLLPLEMSETWAAIKGMKQLQFIQVKKAEFIHNLGWGTANLNKNQRQRIIPYRNRLFNNNYE